MEVTKHYLPATALMPNSPNPILHYRGGPLDILPHENAVEKFYEMFSRNGWGVQWIYRYGPTQRSHYHSSAHECMAVLSGTATIRFGVADTSLDMDENTMGTARESGGIEIEAKPGDVFLLPAGTAHKTYNTKPEAEFTLLSSGDGHHIATAASPDATGDAAREALKQVRLSGFTMLGAYPVGANFWDSLKGGEITPQDYNKVWTLARPGKDPVLGDSREGLVGLWKTQRARL
jgi:uncharacterized protein YjlB